MQPHRQRNSEQLGDPISLRNFENPTDESRSLYEVRVAVSDGTHLVTQNVSVSVTNVNETVVIPLPVKGGTVKTLLLNGQLHLRNSAGTELVTPAPSAERRWHSTREAPSQRHRGHERPVDRQRSGGDRFPSEAHEEPHRDSGFRGVAGFELGAGEAGSPSASLANGQDQIQPGHDTDPKKQLRAMNGTRFAPTPTMI